MEEVIKKIKELEPLSKTLEPDEKKRKEWEAEIFGYAGEFLNEVNSLKGYDGSDDMGKGILDLELDGGPRSLDQILPALKKNVDRAGINPASGGHLGYIPGGGIYTSALGDYLAAVTNRYAGMFFGNPGAVRIENQLIRWMCKLVGFPEGSLGNLTSGGSIANLIAIVTARDVKQIKARDVETAVIYLTEQVHHCVHKAIRIAGMGEAVLRNIPLDAHFRLDAEALKRQVFADRKNGLRPFLVVGSAGTTDTGTMDPLDDIATIATENDMWFHVDAAYGGFFILTDTLKDRFKGIERSDSVAIDPHKGLFLAYGLGAVLIKDVEAQFKSHYYRAAYMQDTLDANEELNPADLSPELTKHFRGLRMWLSLQLFGIEPFKACLEEKYWLCRYFYKAIQKEGFEVGPEPDLSVCIYRYVPEKGDANEFNRLLTEYVKNDGTVFISSTSINGVFWIRLAVLGFRTHLHTIEQCLTQLKNGVEYLKKQDAFF
ncbi:MAG: aminotransferase class V-fold PLP-dependent enzyme [Saprospiraceae bacterium]